MELTCHCGEVRLDLAFIPHEVGECNCSICRRYAAFWGYFSPDDVTTEGCTNFYCWGDKEVEFHRCSNCGCVTHYITTDKCPERILAVNMKLASVETLSQLPKRKINGASY
ncbi:GFA family protein [Vibrio sp. ER1A]|uniref:GFA family protein n=1 Tax=Vibrio sp. ER1A TaxID=1517681 RepID=UPI0009DF65FC|nr:aldehyde-activating protein [Vibrio sp. ER1A]